MRKTFKFLAWSLGLILLCLVVVAGYIELAPLPTYTVDLPEEVSIPYQDSTALARGAKIVSMSCVTCHLNEEGNLSGQLFPEADFGTFYIGNITGHPTTGLGKYSDPELVHLLRTGLRPDGSQLIPVMPQFNRMADEDLEAVIAFLRSNDPLVRPIDQQWPAPELSFLAKALIRFAFKPAPMPKTAVVAPPLTDLPAHGEYLANAIFDCFKCHSASFTSNNDHEPALSVGYYGGGNPLVDAAGQIVPSANLTPHPDYGLGSWTLADFDRAIRSRQRVDGRVLSDAMPLFAGLTDEEVAAIWAFLQSLPEDDNNPRISIDK